MIKKIMKKYALSESGAKDLVKASAACAVSDLCLMLPVGLLFMLVCDMLERHSVTAHLPVLIIGTVLVIVVILVTNYFQYNLTFFNTYKESGRKRVALAEKLRKLPLSFFGKKDLSDLTTVVLGDCATLETAFSHWIPQFFGSIISTVIIAVALLFFDIRLAAAALWVLPVALIIVGASKKVQNRFSRRKNDALLSVNDGIQEYLETVRDLKSCNAQEKYIDELDRRFELLEKRSIGAEFGVAAFVVSAQLLLKFGIATVALVGSMLYVRGSLSVTMFFMYLLVASRIYEPMSGALINFAAIIGCQVNIERTDEITNYPEQSGTRDFSVCSYDIEFKNVSFSYIGGERVLSDVSFIAKQGEVTALIGCSGSGKSTAAKLAARFWDIDGGKITVGGTDIGTVDPEKLLGIYSIVFQEVTLFNNTVRENIRIGNPSADDAQVLAAARAANCDEFVSRLPDGYDTVIGENGSMLSGGERQRISIARAILKNAPIVLLDEATASLDAENETKIQQAISALVKNKTVLVIAHRMRTVANADKIISLENGVVTEQGSPSELLQKNGIYKKFVDLSAVQ